ncbi:MAG: hypothetical protein ACM34K_03555 [Bacillota bacterium]
MIKKLLMILSLPLVLFAQEQNKNTQNVELPEFVITGVERVSMPAAAKPKAELVPTLSTGFFKPQYSPEELPVAELSNPVRKDIIFVNDSAKFNGRLIVGAGVYTIPMGSLTYGKSFNNGLFTGKLWGTNQRSYYKDNSDYNNSGIDLNTDLFSSYNSEFLPGAKFTIGAGYERDAYKFFASDNPALKRERSRGQLRFGLNNLMNPVFKYGVNIKETMSYIKDADLSENTFSAKGYLETGYDGIILGAVPEYKFSKNSFFGTSGYAKFKPSDNLHFSAGLYFAASGDEKSFFPIGTVTLKLSDNLTLLGEMSPYSELVTVTDLVYQNRWLSTKGVKNIYVDNKMNLKGALKYEYGKYFEIDGGFRFVDYNNYPYFVPDDSVKGVFDVRTAKAKRFTGFLNFLFHPGPYGIFYGNVEIEHFNDNNKNYVPYNAGFRSSLSYDYDFDFGLKTESRLAFASSVWADAPNTKQIDPYLNLSLRLGYEIAQGFDLFMEFSNLLNHNNYIYYGYKEKTMDAVFGLDYRF